MNTTTSYPHLQWIDGELHIKSSRYTVLHLAGEHYHYGWTAEELLRQHPDLKPEEVYSALACFYDHEQEFVEQLAVRADRAATLRAPSVSRAELLRRRAANP